MLATGIPPPPSPLSLVMDSPDAIPRRLMATSPISMYSRVLNPTTGSAPFTTDAEWKAFISLSNAQRGLVIRMRDKTARNTPEQNNTPVNGVITNHETGLWAINPVAGMTPIQAASPEFWASRAGKSAFAKDQAFGAAVAQRQHEINPGNANFSEWGPTAALAIGGALLAPMALSAMGIGAGAGVGAAGTWFEGMTAAQIAEVLAAQGTVGAEAAGLAASAGIGGATAALGAEGTWLSGVSEADLAAAGYSPADVAALTQQGAAILTAPEAAGSNGFFDTLGSKVSERFTPTNLAKSAAKNAVGQLVFTGEIDPRHLATGTAMGGLTGAVGDTALSGLESNIGYSPTVADAIWSAGATPASQFVAATTTGGLQGAVSGAVQGGLASGLQGGSVAEGTTRGAVTGGASGLAGAASRDVVQSVPVQGFIGNNRPAFDPNAYSPDIANAIWSEDATISPETADKAWGADAGKWGMADSIWSEDATISPETSGKLFGGTGGYTGEPNYIANTIANQIPGIASQVASNWASSAMAPDAPSFSAPAPTQSQVPGTYHAGGLTGLSGHTDWADVNEFNWRGPEQYSLLGKKVKFNSGSPFGQGTESYGNSNKFGL